MSTPRDRLFPQLSDSDIACLRPFGQEVALASGATLFREGDPEDSFYIVLSGKLKVMRDVGGSEIVLAVHNAHEFTGALAFLTGEPSIATGIAVEDTHLLTVTRDTFAQLLPHCAATARLILTTMAARRPEAEAMTFQHEKLAALGTMAAGLAHELNNPAAAAVRALADLPKLLNDLEDRALALGNAFGKAGASTDLVQARVADILGNALERSQSDKPLTPLERADIEEAIAEWLEKRGASDPYGDAATFTEAHLTAEDLAQIAALAPDEAASDLLCYIEAHAEANTRLHAAHESLTRLSEIVQAVKAYSYMDQAPVQEDVDLTAGLKNTLTVMAYALKNKNIQIEKSFAPDLPRIKGHGSELNQAWTNLLSNAIDAVSEGGVIQVETCHEGDQVVVSIEDNGEGIPPEVLPHIYEPFFTTKPVGEGTGLGLDTTYRIITQRHNGTLHVESEPGRTRFEARLPIG